MAANIADDVEVVITDEHQSYPFAMKNAGLEAKQRIITHKRIATTLKASFTRTRLNLHSRC